MQPNSLQKSCCPLKPHPPVLCCLHFFQYSCLPSFHHNGSVSSAYSIFTINVFTCFQNPMFQNFPLFLLQTHCKNLRDVIQSGLLWTQLHCWNQFLLVSFLYQIALFYDLATCLLLKYLNKAIEGLQDYFGIPSTGAVHHGGVFEVASYIVTAVWKLKVVNTSAQLSLLSRGSSQWDGDYFI